MGVMFFSAHGLFVVVMSIVNGEAAYSTDAVSRLVNRCLWTPSAQSAVAFDLLESLLDMNATIWQKLQVGLDTQLKLNRSTVRVMHTAGLLNRW
ncbi:hypothetical protein Efla_004754 [Eimeria flavescens]